MSSSIAVLSLCIWLYLVFAHGRFWSCGPELQPRVPDETPAVDIVVPARDEAETIQRVIVSLLAQDYAGTFRVILVDDDSSDGTAALAGSAPNLTILSGLPKPPGWSGKLWALHQGITAGRAPVLLLADADIEHDPRHLATLVATLTALRADLVSEMVHLNCESLAERALVPAFIYFFQLLYPFARVNDRRSGVAAAAGGTVLIRRAALEAIGGIESIKGALIDDVTLARSIKRNGGVYLGHSLLAASIRPYPHFSDIWRMIARTAFTQLRYSAVLLVVTLAGLTLVWWIPIGIAILGHGWARACGLGTFALGALSYLPTLARYRRNRWWALLLPGIALFFMAATVGSALDHWRGSGTRWKARDYR